MIYHTIYHSPIGDIELSGDENGIISLYFCDNSESNQKIPSCLLEGYQQLDAYFNGERKEFTLKLNLQGTDFQKEVWQKLIEIPPGTTITYLGLAIMLGDKKKIRAVGKANALNPISIIIPCHRVIGSNGKLIGYGGGLWRKQWLLEFEKAGFQSQLFLEQQ